MDNKHIGRRKFLEISSAAAASTLTYTLDNYLDTVAADEQESKSVGQIKALMEQIKNDELKDSAYLLEIVQNFLNKFIKERVKPSVAFTTLKSIVEAIKTIEKTPGALSELNKASRLNKMQ